MKSSDSQLTKSGRKQRSKLSCSVRRKEGSDINIRQPVMVQEALLLPQRRKSHTTVDSQGNWDAILLALGVSTSLPRDARCMVTLDISHFGYQNDEEHVTLTSFGACRYPCSPLYPPPKTTPIQNPEQIGYPISNDSMRRGGY